MGTPAIWHGEVAKGWLRISPAIPYDTEEALERIIYSEIYAEMESIADCRYCFIEGDMSAIDDPERSWSC